MKKINHLIWHTAVVLSKSKLLPLFGAQCRVEKNGSMGSMPSEIPRLFQGMHKTTAHLKGVLIQNGSTEFHIEIPLALYCVTSQYKNTEIEWFCH